MALLCAFWGSTSPRPHQGCVNTPFQAVAAKTNPQFQLDLASEQQIETYGKYQQPEHRRPARSQRQQRHDNHQARQSAQQGAFHGRAPPSSACGEAELSFASGKVAREMTAASDAHK